MADGTTLNTMAGGDVIATDDITGGVANAQKVQRIKAGFGPDNSYSDVATTNPLPAVPYDSETNTSTLTGTGTVISLTGLNGTAVGVVTVAGTYAATLRPEVSFDNGSTWQAATLSFPLGGGTPVAGALAANATGTWIVDIGGASAFRLNCTAWTSNTSGTFRIRATTGPAEPVAQDPLGFLTVTGGYVSQSFSTTSVTTSTPIDCATLSRISIHITSQGTSSVVAFQGSNDNTNWVGLVLSSQGSNTSAPLASSTGSSGVIYGGTLNFRYFRLNVTGITLGTTAATMVGFANSGTMGINQAAVMGTVPAGSAVSTYSPVMMGGSDSTNVQRLSVSTSGEVNINELPAAAAAADALTNPTISQIGADPHLFNGTSWDRMRGTWRTTTGDTGAKTVTFNGATQTNFNHAAAWITCLCGTVSGTTPTMTMQLQVSFDAGTTWVNVGPATGNMTATGNTGLVAVGPLNWSQAAGTTPVNLTSGHTVAAFVNAPLPRTWRIVYTIAGTTPSFTITSVSVDHMML